MNDIQHIWDVNYVIYYIRWQNSWENPNNKIIMQIERKV